MSKDALVCHPWPRRSLLATNARRIGLIQETRLLPAILLVAGKNTFRRESGSMKIGDERTDVARGGIAGFLGPIEIALDAVGKVLR